MIRCRFYILFVAALFLAPPLLKGQIDDVGLWVGASVNKKFTRRLEGSINEQIRFNQNASRIDLLLTDGGLEYGITKKLKAGIHYRFINSNKENYYSKRHRFYFDVAWKEKIKFVTLTLRERIQEQFSDYYSSETGKIPDWVMRSKIAAKFDIDKKYTPYVSGELFYLIDDAKEDDSRFTTYRLECGIDYEFNRVHGVNPFVLFQHEFSAPFDELIYGIMYSYSF